VGLRDRISPGRRKARRSLYVHLADDGGIFVMRGFDGAGRWVTPAQLHSELAHTRDRRGTLVYSRENPDEEPGEQVFALFQEMVEYELPLRVADEPHPRALVPPGERG
jgi:hypothetical protein